MDLPDGDALAVVRDIPALGYLRPHRDRSRRRAPRPTRDRRSKPPPGGSGSRIDPGTGAIASLTGPDGKERVNPSSWSGLNQLVYVTGGDATALWTSGDRHTVAATPSLTLNQATLVSARRERLPGIGVRLRVERKLEGFPAVSSTVTLYDDLPWIDIENQVTKTATTEKEALYVAFPFAFLKPTVEVEVPLGRMTVEQDQQPGACRDWYCHQHWVWMHEGADGILWSGPDTPLFTLNDIFRGLWRRRIAPDGTLFSYAMNNYWFTNYAARQGGAVHLPLPDLAARARGRRRAGAPRLGRLRPTVRGRRPRQPDPGPPHRPGYRPLPS